MSTECRAVRWRGTPVYEGPHQPHFFTYGPFGMYTGSCIGRTEDVDSSAVTTTDDLPQTMHLSEILWHSFRQNVHNDEANAAVHCASVRYSPLTFRLAEYLWNQFPVYRNRIELARVAADLGAYAEDLGR